jgi:hypothetical protein
MAKKIDSEFLTRTLMCLASEPAIERLSDKHNVRVMFNVMLKELGVRTPYPPVADPV